MALISVRGRSEIIRTAEIVVTRLMKQLPTTKSQGGYLCLADSTGHPVLVTLIGQVPSHDGVGVALCLRYEYFTYACEKAHRLAEHPDHISSWQSLDMTQAQYAGAIRLSRPVPSLLLSFSGLPQLADEAVCLTIGVIVGLITHEDAQKIATLSDNHYFEELLENASAAC